METVKVYLNHSDDDFFITRINGTREEIARYYMNNFFNFGIEKDNMKKCTKIEFLGEE